MVRLMWAAVAQSLLRLYYGMNGKGIETLWGPTVSTPVQTGPGTTQPTVTRVRFVFPGVKAAGVGRWSSTPSKAEVKERD